MSTTTKQHQRRKPRRPTYSRTPCYFCDPGGQDGQLCLVCRQDLTRKHKLRRTA